MQCLMLCWTKIKFQVNILEKIDGIIIVIYVDVIGQLALLRSMME